MLRKTIIVLLAIWGFNLTQMSASAQTLDQEPVVVRHPAHKDTLAIKRNLMSKALGDKMAIADTVAEGGINFNPFAPEYIAKRFSPYETSLTMPDSNGVVKKNGYIPGPWHRRLFFGLGAGFNAYIPFDKSSPDKTKPGVNVAVFGGYKFNGLHSVRLTLNFNTSNVYLSGVKKQLLAFEVMPEYMLNLTNYLYGVNPRRAWDVQPAVGAGLVVSNIPGKTRIGVKGRIALNVSYRLNDNLAVYAEPFFAYQNEGANMALMNARYDVPYGIFAGLRYDIVGSNRGERLRMPGFNKNLFVDLMMGWQAERGDQRGILRIANRSLGANYQAALGSWFDPILGWRVGISGGDYSYETKGVRAEGIGQSTQINPSYTTSLRGSILTGRFELMFRPLNFIRMWRETDHAFDMDISVGGELGFLGRTKLSGPEPYIHNFAFGGTVAGDLLYRIAPGVSAVVQGRVEFLKAGVRNGGYNDLIGSINAGFRLQIPTLKERLLMIDPDNDSRIEVGISAGSLKLVARDLQNIKSNKPLNFNVSAYAMYHFTERHSLMGQIEYQHMGMNKFGSYKVSTGYKGSYKFNGLMKQHVNTMQLKLMYAFNVTNWLLHANYDRQQFNIYALIGPAFSIGLGTNTSIADGGIAGGEIISDKLSNNKKKLAFGMAGGFLASYDFSRRFGVFIQPEIQVMGGNAAYGNTPEVKRFPYMLFKFQAGVKMNF